MKKNLFPAVAALVLCLANLFCAVGSYAAETFPAYVKGTEKGAKIRSRMSAGSEIIGDIQEGEYITVTGRTGDWYKVSTGGFVHADYVTYVTPTDIEPADPKLLWDAEYASTNYKYSPSQAIGIEEYDRIGRKGATMHTSIGSGFTIDPIDDESDLNDLFSMLGIGGITTVHDETIKLHAGAEVYVYCLLNAGNANVAAVQADGKYGYVYSNFLEMFADDD